MASGGFNVLDFAADLSDYSASAEWGTLADRGGAAHANTNAPAFIPATGANGAAAGVAGFGNGARNGVQMGDMSDMASVRSGHTQFTEQSGLTFGTDARTATLRLPTGIVDDTYTAWDMSSAVRGAAADAASVNTGMTGVAGGISMGDDGTASIGTGAMSAGGGLGGGMAGTDGGDGYSHYGSTTDGGHGEGGYNQHGYGEGETVVEDVNLGGNMALERLPAHACSYCGIHASGSVVKCGRCNKWFCNGRAGSSGSHIVNHLVRSKHNSVGLHPDSALGDAILECYCCGTNNVFLLGFIPSKTQPGVVVLLCREPCLNRGELRDQGWDLDTWDPLIKDRSFLDWLVKPPSEREVLRARPVDTTHIQVGRRFGAGFR